MKINIYGILIVFISIVNIIFSTFIFIINDLGLTNLIYSLLGLIISVFFIYLILRRKKTGYLGIIIFYGIQIIDSEFIFDNFRYGLIFKGEYSINLNNSDLLVGLNFTAILLAVLGVLGYITVNKNSKKIFNNPKKAKNV